MYEVHPSPLVQNEWLLYKTGDGGFDLIGTFADKKDALTAQEAFENLCIPTTPVS